MFDYLIIGCGYTGAVLAERIASQLNKKVIIVERRNHIAGNAYDYYDEHGILVHKYGPHIFHTNSKKVWEYLSKFTSWHAYTHHVLVALNGKKVPLPFNFNSIRQCFSHEEAQRLEKSLISKFGLNKNVHIRDLQNSDHKDLKYLSEYVYENVFLNYNLKQWGLKPEKLDASVSGRVPIFTGKDNRYFHDRFQRIPQNGYTAMFHNILNHPKIHLLLNTNYKDIIDVIPFNKLIYTGPVDYFFDYKFGKLPYRSLSFKFESHDKDYFQENAQVNFPSKHDYTRITEFKHITGQQSLTTTIAFEYSKAHDYYKTNEPFYPIPNKENQILFEKYNKEVSKLNKVYLAGRLANYKYYNMDQVVANALSVFEKKIN